MPSTSGATSRRGRTRTRSGAETREQIIIEARQLIAERGYRHMTMKAVAERVGVTEPAVYRHFDGKAELLVTVFREVVAASHLSMSDEPGRPLLATYPRSVADLAGKDLHMLRRLIVEMYSAAALEEDVAQLSNEFVAWAAKRTQRRLREAMAQGEIPESTNVRFMQSFIHIFMAGLAHHETLAPDLVGDKDWAAFVDDAIRALLLHDFAPGAGEGGKGQ